MATADDLRRLALALDGTTEVRHFDRRAFRVDRIYATVPADGLTANLKLSPDEQALKCAVLPKCFAPVPNAWGAQGWTTVILRAITDDDLEAALALAWAGARGKAKRRNGAK